MGDLRSSPSASVFQWSRNNDRQRVIRENGGWLQRNTKGTLEVQNQDQQARLFCLWPCGQKWQLANLLFPPDVFASFMDQSFSSNFSKLNYRYFHFLCINYKRMSKSPLMKITKSPFFMGMSILFQWKWNSYSKVCYSPHVVTSDNNDVHLIFFSIPGW